MNIAYITTKPPSLKSGSEVRNYHLLNALLQESKVTKVTLLYVNYDASAADISLQNVKLNPKVFSLPKRSTFKAVRAYIGGTAPYVEHLVDNPFVDELVSVLRKVDAVVISELDGYLIAKLALAVLKIKPKIILDCHNVDHLRFQSDILLSSFPKNIIGCWLFPKMKRDETEALNMADIILCCSEKDRSSFSIFVPVEKIVVVPNGAEISTKFHSTKKSVNDNSVLFMGLLSYMPNEDGIKYYLEDIHPIVEQQVPNIKCIVVGKNPPQWLKDLSEKNPRIKVKGFVKDTKEYLEAATVCICPLRFGSGTRLKILEYMGARKAVVSTSIGAEGISVSNGKDILIEDTPTSFAHAIVSLIKNPHLAKRIGDASHLLISEQYDWRNIGKQFAMIVTGQR